MGRISCQAAAVCECSSALVQFIETARLRKARLVMARMYATRRWLAFWCLLYEARVSRLR